MNNLNENNLKEAVRLYAQKMADSFPDEGEVSDVVFSDGFERKMNRIIKQRKKPFFKIFNTAAKRAACAAAVFIVILSLSLSVKAVREPFLKLLQKVFYNHIELEFEGDRKDYIAEIYAVTEIPEGYTLTDETTDVIMVDRIYEKEEGTLFSYTQYATENVMANIDNEHSKHYKKTVDDTELYIADFEEDNMKIVYWVQDGYLFNLTFYGRLSDDEIIPIIRSNTIVGYQKEE